MVDKEQKTKLAVLSDGSIRAQEAREIPRAEGRTRLYVEGEITAVIGEVGTVTLKLAKRLQQIPGTTSKVSVKKRAGLGTAGIQCSFSFPHFLVCTSLILFHKYCMSIVEGSLRTMAASL